MRFCRQIHEHAVLSNQGRAPHDILDFSRGNATIHHRVSPHEALCIRDDALLLARIVRQRDQEVLGQSKAEDVGIADLDLPSVAIVELVNEGFDVVGTTNVLPCDGGCEVGPGFVKLAAALP